MREGEKKSGMVYPTTLAVNLGVINGQRVQDAYMTTDAAMNRFVIPILGAAGYQVPEAVTPKRTRKKKHADVMSPEEMLKQMQKFNPRK